MTRTEEETPMPAVPDDPPEAAPPRAAQVGMLRAMHRIRFFEDEVRDLFARDLVRGSTHLCQGQEAVPVGTCGALRDGDTMTCTYRGHGAVLAMGASVEASFAEILGRATGLCRGKGGSMHLTDVPRGALGSFAIVGAHVPVTVGAAWAARHTGSGAVAVSFFGDGAVNIGAVHESLNLAGVWRLPAVFVIENNLYGEYSPIAATTADPRLADRAAVYGMPGVRVDGNDVLAVRAAAGEAVRRARAGEGPTLIEAMTYRQQGHSRSDPGAYRPEGELERWLERDPIALFRRRLAESGADPAELDRHEAEVRREVAAALERALAAPEPAAAERLEDVWA